jgi:P-type Cu2+ transporter
MMNALAADDRHALWSDASGGRARSVFAAQGMRCAACARSIERAVQAVPGVAQVQVNVATARVCVDWRVSEGNLPQILEAVRRAGFTPVPLSGEKAAAVFAHERREALKRIGLAGIGMMQVMMYVLGIYIASPDSMDPAIASYLRYVGLAITTPVLAYSGAPFFHGAWRDLREWALGMDVPVALALALAYAASLFNTVRGHGETYFDSVTMFIFFLGAGRYVEMVVRQRNLSLNEALARSLPSHVSRVKADGTSERVLIERIESGDRLLVPKGGVIPVDADLSTSEALIDESLITGESRPERRAAGTRLAGGAVNVGKPIELIARATVSSSTLASIVALLERAQAARPRLAHMADRAATVFVGAILIIALGVAIAWMYVDPARAFAAALAVLVVTCPCALSLATPVAIAAATTRLARSGLLVTRADGLERLAAVDVVVFDKTGTLTSGTPRVVKTNAFGKLSPQVCRAIAAALERGSAHPLAAAFVNHASPDFIAREVREYEGCGMEGEVAGSRWRLGSRAFVEELCGTLDPGTDDSGILLGSESGLCAVFEVGESIRAESPQAIDAFAKLGITTVLASGDREAAVNAVAREVGFVHAHARLTPADKADLVRRLQSRGHRVLMLGDGINDGPVLAAASVSCAMGQGSAIAQAAADFLLLNDSLQAVAEGVADARRMRSVIRQNLKWALIYNVLAVPLAALGYVPPWAAALGMSVSSLFVVLNARRLARRKP